MGKYDQLTGCFVDALWIVIKKSYDHYNKTGEKIYASKSNNVKIDKPSFKYQFIIKREPGSSQYKLDANTYKNKITVCLIIDPEIEPNFYNELNFELQGTVRHEIEHILQEMKVPEKAKFPTCAQLKKINKNASKYLNAKSEIGPMVHGFYRIAKTKKEKIDVIMSSFLNEYKQNHAISKSQASHIKRKWLDYSHKYFPEAQYKSIREDLRFERGLDPKRAMGIGIVEQIINACKDVYILDDRSTFEYISLEIFRKIIDFLLSKNWTAERIIKLTHSRHFQWSFTTIVGYDEKVFEKYYKWNMNGIQTFGLGGKDKGVREGLKFERGLNPKEAMGIGMFAPLDTDVKNREKIIANVYFIIKNHNRFKNVFLNTTPLIEFFCNNTNIRYGFYYAWSVKKYFLDVGLHEKRKSIYIRSIADLLEITEKYESGKLKESNFQRGLEPKVAMDIGMMRYLKPALLDNDSDGHEELCDWLKENPTLAKELQFDFSNPKEYENIVGIEIDYYCENINPGVEAEDLKNEFRVVKRIKTGGINPTKSGKLAGEVNVVIGKLYDGSKVIYYYGGLISGYAARKEWLKGKTNESNFERGIDPKRAMDVGHQKILKDEAAKYDWDWDFEEYEWSFVPHYEMIYQLTEIVSKPEPEYWNSKVFPVKISEIFNSKTNKSVGFYAVSITGEPYAFDGPDIFKDPKDALNQLQKLIDEIS